MSTINFTATEILPALLDKSKTQTIRKAWVGATTDEEVFGYKLKDPNSKPIPIFSHAEKPPRFKVGDVVSLVWDEDGKYDYYFKDNGQSFGSMADLTEAKNDIIFEYSLFHKNLGKVEITEVFTITMDKNQEFKTACGVKEEGFKDAETMFAYFDKNYDISTPKKFHVYRWRYL